MMFGSTTERAGRLMPAESVSVQTATESSLCWNSSSTIRRYLGSRPAWCTPTPRSRTCLSFGPAPLRPVVLLELLAEPGLLAGGQHPLALELLGDAPALLAVEAEDQGGRQPRGLVPLGHSLDLLGEQLVGHPLEDQRHLALAPFDQFQRSLMG